jgi:hypothetical protein
MSLQDIKLGKLCDSIIGINKNIQSVAIINKLGRPIEKVTRDTSQKQLPQTKDEMLFMQCVLEISMGKDFDSEYGSINYHLSERENLTMITFPIRDYVILVTTKKDTSPISLAKKIVTTINGYQTRQLNVE